MRADLAAGDATRPTVIVCTYEQPKWLELVLWGYATQTHREFDLVVADDGSGPETRAVVERFEAASGRAVLHVWHEDRGFRKAEILNRAILASSGDYVIFTDGDCIPRDDFVATHVRLAARGTYVSGAPIRLPAALSDRVTVDDVCTGRVAEWEWLRAQGWRDWTHAPSLRRQPVATALLDRLARRAPRLDGGNAATWRALLVAANGFDLDMTWGEEDRALGLRLEHMGVRGTEARSRAIALHLEHGRPHRTEEALRQNRAIVARIRANREVRAPRGLAELRAHLRAASQPAVALPDHQPAVS